MLKTTEHILFTRELERLQKDLKNCSDNQVRQAINQEILLLLKVLSMTARK